MSECCSVKVFSVNVVLPYVVFKIGYVSATSMPANTLAICFFLTIDRNLHAIVKHWITLRIVKYIEFNWMAHLCVLYVEIKPLCVAFRIDVVLHEAVVFLIWDLLGKEQVAWLESWLKVEGKVIMRFALVLITVEFYIRFVCAKDSLSCSHEWTLATAPFIFLKDLPFFE